MTESTGAPSTSTTSRSSRTTAGRAGATWSTRVTPPAATSKPIRQPTWRSPDTGAADTAPSVTAIGHALAMTEWEGSVASVRAGADPAVEAGSLVAAMPPAERRGCLDGDLPFWAGLADMG